MAYPFLVADIGGTNARFALALERSEGRLHFGEQWDCQVRNYSTFQMALEAYFKRLPSNTAVHGGCAALACPIEDKPIKLTNANWTFVAAELCSDFGWERLEFINDFAALALAVNELAAEDLYEIKPGQIQARANKAILGPGTGLGVAALAYKDDTCIPIASQGGHINLAPATELECEVIKVAMDSHKYISAETFLSGPGLMNLYKALSSVRGERPQALSSADISAAGLSGEDALCRESLQLFCSFLGTVAGNFALSYGAKGGVYLGGGILPKMTDFLIHSNFTQRFSLKGAMSDYMQDIPVYLITHPYPAFLGAAAFYERT